MKRVITLFAVLLMGWSVNAWSFACKTANGTAIPIGGGSANVYVNLTPAVNVGQNLVVDLSTQIFCHNDYPETITDYVTPVSYTHLDVYKRQSSFFSPKTTSCNIKIYK